MTNNAEQLTSVTLKRAGMQTLVQDLGRYGKHHLGLTTGGPLDPFAFNFANRLCANADNTTALEVTVGGLHLIANGPIKIAVTGANMPLTINGVSKALWQSHILQQGDELKLGFASQGLRSYLAIRGGFAIEPQFESCATVCREKIGGITGEKLIDNQQLPCYINNDSSTLKLAPKFWPNYSNEACLRVVLGYQHQHFSTVQKQLFFSSTYSVDKLADRMGYRLNGQAITANLSNMLSEGICHGAIQIPADGQPIVLLNDRQTIGGYPKIGSVIALDTAKLAQLGPGSKVTFEQISIEQAHNIKQLQRVSERKINLIAN